MKTVREIIRGNGRKDVVGDVVLNDPQEEVILSHMLQSYACFIHEL